MTNNNHLPSSSLLTDTANVDEILAGLAATPSPVSDKSRYKQDVGHTSLPHVFMLCVRVNVNA